MKFAANFFEICKGTEKVMLVKFMEAIPVSGSHFFSGKRSF